MKKHAQPAKGILADLTESQIGDLDRFCYLKVKIEELEEEKSDLQKEILDWDDRPEELEVPPYGALKLNKRANWIILNIPGIFKKVGKDSFLGICSVPAGKLKKLIGEIGFKKLVGLKYLKKGEDSEFYTLKRNGVFKAK